MSETQFCKAYMYVQECIYYLRLNDIMALHLIFAHKLCLA